MVLKEGGDFWEGEIGRRGGVGVFALFFWCRSGYVFRISGRIDSQTRLLNKCNYVFRILDISSSILTTNFACNSLFSNTSLGIRLSQILRVVGYPCSFTDR